MRTLWPVIERELRVASRRPQTWRLRLLTSTGAGAILLLLIWFFGRDGMNATSGQVGSIVFFLVSGLVGIWSLFVGGNQTSDSLGRERRDGTLGLLFLTDLSGWSVVGGKLFAAGLDTVFQMLAVVPVLVVPVLLGGVGLEQLALLLLAMGNGLFLSLVSGLLASLLSRDPRQASGLGIAWILALTVLPWGLFGYLTNRSAVVPAASVAWVLLPSPSVPFIGAMTTVPTVPFSQWRLAALVAVAVQVGLSTVLFVVTARWVRTAWQDGGGPGWKLLLEGWAQRIRYGGAERRERWRRRWLDVGAWEWISLRDVWKPWLPWVLLAAHAGLLGALCLSVGYGSVVGQGSALMGGLFHVLFLFWVAGESAITLHEQRVAGAFELLLTSGLRPAEILRAQGSVLLRLLLVPVGLLTLFDIWVAVSLPWTHSNWAGAEVGIGFWTHVSCVILTPLQWMACRWASTRSVVSGHAVNRAVGLAINKAVILPGVLSYGAFGGLAMMLNLAHQLPEEFMLLLAFVPSTVLNGLWCWVFGRRQKRWVTERFLECLSGGGGGQGAAEIRLTRRLFPRGAARGRDLLQPGPGGFSDP